MKWSKFFIGVMLLPTLAATAWALVDLMTQGWKGQDWHAPWFYGLIGGVTLWSVAYFSLPRPMWIYVFGHEFTHALAVYLTGGRVIAFRVATYGGHVKTDTVNWWITLSPYFIPIYCLIWIALWLSINFYYPLRDLQWLLYGGVGITWGFHLTFTISMIKQGQSDITSQGYLFSLVIILLINLLLIELFLTGSLEHYSFEHWGSDLWHRFVMCYRTSWFWIVAFIKWCWQQGTELWHNLHYSS